MARPFNIKRGALHRQLGLAVTTHIPMSTLTKLARSKNARTRRRAQFAINARSWPHGR